MRVLSLVAAAWLLIQIVNVHHERNAVTKLAKNPAAVRPEARAARRLNPDRYPLLLIGASYLFSGDRVRAAQTFEQLARAEPDNVRAWALLYQTTKSPLAAAQIRRLSPLR